MAYDWKKKDEKFSARPVGQAVLVRWLRRLLPARLFEPNLRKAFALDPSSKGAAVTEPRTQAATSDVKE